MRKTVSGALSVLKMFKTALHGEKVVHIYWHTSAFSLRLRLSHAMHAITSRPCSRRRRSPPRRHCWGLSPLPRCFPAYGGAVRTGRDTPAARGQGSPPPLRKPWTPARRAVGVAAALLGRYPTDAMQVLLLDEEAAWVDPAAPRGRRCGGLPPPRAWRAPGETKRSPDRLFGAGRRWPTHHHIVIGGGIGAALCRDTRPTAYSRHLSDDGAQTPTRLRSWT